MTAKLKAALPKDRNNEGLSSLAAELDLMRDIYAAIGHGIFRIEYDPSGEIQIKTATNVTPPPGLQIRARAMRDLHKDGQQ